MENKKTAFVTGANKGIGLATVKLLAERGYQEQIPLYKAPNLDRVSIPL